MVGGALGPNNDFPGQQAGIRFRTVSDRKLLGSAGGLYGAYRDSSVASIRARIAEHTCITTLRT